MRKSTEIREIQELIDRNTMRWERSNTDRCDFLEQS